MAQLYLESIYNMHPIHSVISPIERRQVMGSVLSTPQSSNFSLSRELEALMTPEQKQQLALLPPLPTCGAMAGSSGVNVLVPETPPTTKSSLFVDSPIPEALSPPESENNI